MNTTALPTQLSRIQRNAGDAYLRLQLNHQTPAVVAMEHTQEVLVVPAGRITPMPNMPACVLGLLNQRSRVLWVVDLPQMLDLQAFDADVQQYNIAIVRVGNIPLGLVVQEVKGVMRLTAASLQPPMGTVAPGLIAYLRGCILQQTEVLLVLDAEAIVHSPVLQGNQLFH